MPRHTRQIDASGSTVRRRQLIPVEEGDSFNLSNGAARWSEVIFLRKKKKKKARMKETLVLVHFISLLEKEREWEVSNEHKWFHSFLIMTWVSRQYFACFISFHPSLLAFPRGSQVTHLAQMEGAHETVHLFTLLLFPLRDCWLLALVYIGGQRFVNKRRRPGKQKEHRYTHTDRRELMLVMLAVASLHASIVIVHLISSHAVFSLRLLTWGHFICKYTLNIGANMDSPHSSPLNKCTTNCVKRCDLHFNSPQRRWNVRLDDWIFTQASKSLRCLLIWNSLDIFLTEWAHCHLWDSLVNLLIAFQHVLKQGDKMLVITATTRKQLIAPASNKTLAEKTVGMHADRVTRVSAHLHLFDEGSGFCFPLEITFLRDRRWHETAACQLLVKMHLICSPMNHWTFIQSTVMSSVFIAHPSKRIHRGGKKEEEEEEEEEEKKRKHVRNF